jgi:hypothetical protein
VHLPVSVVSEVKLRGEKAEIDYPELWLGMNFGLIGHFILIYQDGPKG